MISVRRTRWLRDASAPFHTHKRKSSHTLFLVYSGKEKSESFGEIVLIMTETSPLGCHKHLVCVRWEEEGGAAFRRGIFVQLVSLSFHTLSALCCCCCCCGRDDSAH